jgi:hypothetical protein
MSHIMPWLQPYDKLIRQLHQHFGGELSSPSGVESAFAADGDGLARVDHPLPSLKAVVKGVPLFFEVTANYMLHVHLSQPQTVYLKLRQRGFFDRLMIYLHMGGAVKSGNPKFDRSFATDMDTRDNSSLLYDGEVQKIIFSLVPFEFLEIHKGGIHFARDIASAHDLSYAATEKTIVSLHRLIVLASVA